MKALNRTLSNLDVKMLRLSTGGISARFMADKDNVQAEVIWGVALEMVLPKEGSGDEMEANALTKKGAKNPAARQFLDWAASDEAMALDARYFAAVAVAGMPVPEGLPKDIGKVVYPNDFDQSVKNRDRILAEWQKRYAK